MCYYITTTLPKETNLERLRLLLEDFKIDFTQINNLNIETQLIPKEMYFRATKSYCDCGTVLGSQRFNYSISKQVLTSTHGSHKGKNLARVVSKLSICSFIAVSSTYF